MQSLKALAAIIAAGVMLAALSAGATGGFDNIAHKLATLLAEPQNTLSRGGWAAGVVTGLAIAWACAVDWRGIPGRTAGWVQQRRTTFGWLLVSLASLGVIVIA